MPTQKRVLSQPGYRSGTRNVDVWSWSRSGPKGFSFSPDDYLVPEPPSADWRGGLL